MGARGAWLGAEVGSETPNGDPGATGPIGCRHRHILMERGDSEVVIVDVSRNFAPPPPHEARPPPEHGGSSTHRHTSSSIVRRSSAWVASRSAWVANLRESQRWSLSSSRESETRREVDNEKAVTYVPLCCLRRSEANTQEKAATYALPLCCLRQIEAHAPYGCNYIWAFPLHILRAFKSGALDSKMASPSEEAHICRRYMLQQPTPEYYPTALNLLPWRRSAMVVLILSMVMTASFTSFEASLSNTAYLRYTELSPQPFDGTQVRGCTAGAAGRVCALSLGDYIAHVARVTHASVLVRCQFCVMLTSSLSALMAWTSLILALLAIHRWDDYPISVLRLRIGWLCTVLMPFALSFVPLRLLIDTSRLRPAIGALATELSVVFEGISRDAALTNLTHDLTTPCFMLNATATPPLILANATAGDGRDVGTTALLELCAALEAISMARVAGGSGTSADSILDAAAARARPLVEGAVGLVNGAATLRTMVPTAVSIAPALLRGALKCKMMLPQSSIPGMFIVLLPWLYCPLAWCCYNFVFQLVGDFYSLGGVFLISWAPLAYSFLGLYFQARHQPIAPSLHHTFAQAFSHLPRGELLLSGDAPDGR